MRCQNLINELKEKEKQLEKKQEVFGVFFGAKCNLPYKHIKQKTLNKKVEGSTVHPLDLFPKQLLVLLKSMKCCRNTKK